MFCDESILNALQESYLALVRFLLPEGILDYFELSKIVEGLTGLHIYLEEKNLPPELALKILNLNLRAFCLRYTSKTFQFEIKRLRSASNAAGGKSRIRVRLSAEIGMWCNRGLG